jgi:hypothetical protein
MYCKYYSTTEIRDSSITCRGFPVYIEYQNGISISRNRKHYIHIKYYLFSCVRQLFKGIVYEMDVK